MTAARDRTLRTERLTLRPVHDTDLDAVVTLGEDERVMASLGGTSTRKTCKAWLDAQLAHWKKHDYGRFYVTAGTDFVGLVGLTRLELDEGIVPGVEIAWRLAFDQWGRGYAIEAARASIRDGFERIGLTEVIGITTPANSRSIHVMERLGMIPSPSETFEHPRVPAGDPLRTHVLYRLRASV